MVSLISRCWLEILLCRRCPWRRRKKKSRGGNKDLNEGICRVYGVNGVEVEMSWICDHYRCAIVGSQVPFFSYGRDGHPPRSPLMTLVFGWRLGLVFGRWTFKSRGLFQGLPVCKNLFDAIYSDLKKKTKSCKHSFTPPKSNECPLKINGWFRCISCWNGPFLGGHSLVFQGVKDHRYCSRRPLIDLYDPRTRSTNPSAGRGGGTGTLKWHGKNMLSFSQSQGCRFVQKETCFWGNKQSATDGTFRWI